MGIWAAMPCKYCGTYYLMGSQCDCRTKLPPVIIGEGDVDDQVRYAIHCVCGEDRIIKKVTEGHSRKPEGTRSFMVTSESSTCEHETRCCWLDHVYWYQNRSVVIEQSQRSTTIMGNVIKQMKGEED